ncbi:MAG: MarR family winged helix-turn-helix transcriptional regulator [Alphaproteobacteria bacterium]
MATPDQKLLLELCHDMMGGLVRDHLPDLTIRQLNLLLAVYLKLGPHTVRSLSSHLGIAKPAITRAIDKLQDLGFVKRKPDPEDGRSVLIQRTINGSVYLADMGEKFSIAGAKVFGGKEGLDIA